jgi:predicted molibdopterin-dependent oxidoreductase YjgC
MGKRYERLTKPLVRIDGQLVETTWDVALERAAEGFRATTGETGMFSCSKATNEMNYVAQKFARTVFHTNNVDSCNRT